MKNLLAYFICLTLTGCCGWLLLSCDTWELPTRKSQRECVKPSGTLTAQTQQRKVDFSISGASGTIDKVIWDFGNGSTTATTGTTVSYTYPDSKAYTAKATLTNSCGLETTIQQMISVSDAVLPTVTLQAITAVSTTSAMAGMSITSTGNATISRYGICYSPTNMVPDETKDPKEERTGAVAVNTPIPLSLTGLQPNTFYYARSYAVNLVGPVYSSPVQTFRTGQNPVVAANGTASIGVTTASINFVVLNFGSPAAIEYGIYYSSSTNMPDVNSPAAKVISPAIGANVIINLTNLTPNKTYYYRSYARLPSGEIIYGPIMPFTTQSDPVAQDLIASVAFTDGSLQDVSGFNNNVKLVGNPTFTTDHTGRSNSAILLNGTSDYFYMPDNSTLNQTDALSISVWIKPGSFNGRTEDYNKRMQIYNKSKFDTGENEMYSSQIKLVNDVGPDVEFLTDIKQGSNCQIGKSWQDVSFVKPVEFDKWYHLVFTYSGRSVRMYFNNLLVKTLDTPTDKIDYCPGGELKFGAQTKNYNLPWYFKGAMDDIRIYKRALSAAEIDILSKQ